MNRITWALSTLGRVFVWSLYIVTSGVCAGLGKGGGERYDSVVEVGLKGAFCCPGEFKFPIGGLLSRLLFTSVLFHSFLFLMAAGPALLSLNFDYAGN